MTSDCNVCNSRMWPFGKRTGPSRSVYRMTGKANRVMVISEDYVLNGNIMKSLSYHSKYTFNAL